mgnify:CR=1 FL=1
MSTRLVIGIGNPSRGDDAIGPRFIERLQALDLPGVECLTDFQLQVEHVLDLHGRAAIVFVDAAASGPSPFAFTHIAAMADASVSSHALSPPALLAAYRQHYAAPAPVSHVLAIRGHAFELGAGLSPAAAANLDAGFRFLLAWLDGKVSPAATS